MMGCLRWAVFALWVSVVGAHAQAQVAVLMDQLKVAELIDIMRVEGTEYADSLNTDMLNGQGGPVWSEQVQGIYDPHRMSEMVRSDLAKLSKDHLQQINQFYASDLGIKVIDLEMAGRRAMMQEELTDLAEDAYQIALAQNPETLDAIHAIDRAGDMVERNVTTALTANYRFYLGMVDGGAFVLTEDEMLAEAWAQEDEVRQDTQNWLMGYLMLSYQPLDEAETAGLVEFVQTPAGRALNAAIFEGFGAMYADISYALGRAVALNMVGSDL
jgi:hypothetical protein